MELNKDALQIRTNQPCI